MYAVVKISGKQFKVSEGDVITVGKLNSKDKKVTFEDVLLVSVEGKVKVGNPSVKNAKVTAAVLENKKGDKIRVSKFKSKVRYRKTIGFRPQFSVLKIEKIQY